MRMLHHLSVATITLGVTASAAHACDEPHGNGAMTQAALEHKLGELGLPSFEGLTADSDFSVYVAKGVPDEVKWAAYRKAYELTRPVWDAAASDYPCF